LRFDESIAPRLSRTVATRLTQRRKPWSTAPVAREKIGDVMATPSFLVISGLPASGKSTLAARLGIALGLPVIDKDTLLEALFDTVDVRDADHRRTLSRRADEQLRQQALGHNAAILVSWWRHPRSSVDTGTDISWLQAPDMRVIEVFVDCLPEVAATRFRARQRHVGHQDDRWSAPPLLDMFEAHHALGPLGFAACLRVSGVDGAEIDPLCVAVRRRWWP
jgi:adenylylsulfate kinase-like enzyme